MNDKYLPSGEWEGFYTYDLINMGKHKMSCVFEFKNCVVKGSGVDDVDAYVWNGNYDKEIYKVNLVKKYPSHVVNYNGYADENGLWGKWSIGNMTGGFHLWPIKREAEQMKLAEKKQKKGVLQK